VNGFAEYCQCSAADAAVHEPLCFGMLSACSAPAAPRLCRPTGASTCWIQFDEASCCGGYSNVWRMERGTAAGCLARPPNVNAIPPPYMKGTTRHGLVIGIDKYADARLNLRCAVADARVLRELMIDAECCKTQSCRRSLTERSLPERLKRFNGEADSGMHLAPLAPRRLFVVRRGVERVQVAEEPRYSDEVRSASLHPPRHYEQVVHSSERCTRHV
jgi:hypothetical protein